MCEYCGCLEVTAIAELTAEHDIVVSLSGDIHRALAAGDLAEAAAKARAIGVVLGPHTAVEEGALFPVMAAEFGEHVRGLIEEHRLVELVLAEAADGIPTSQDWPDRIERALEILREHIIREQDGLFPAAMAVLDPADWDRVDDMRTRVGTALPVV